MKEPKTKYIDWKQSVYDIFNTMHSRTFMAKQIINLISDLLHQTQQETREKCTKIEFRKLEEL